VNNRAKVFWFRHYWWVAPTVAAVAVALILWRFPGASPGLVPAVVGGCLGLVYFVQKQKLEETQLFERLFKQFNERYAGMNDSLEDVHAGRVADAAEVRRIVNAYFNLCAEEFLFYTQGRIHPAAWRAWCNGMLYYLQHPLFQGHWDAEVTPGPYYGLTRQAIEEGAGLADQRVRAY
jgi:hypothetical protein